MSIYSEHFLHNTNCTVCLANSFYKDSSKANVNLTAQIVYIHTPTKSK